MRNFLRRSWSLYKRGQVFKKGRLLIYRSSYRGKSVCCCSLFYQADKLFACFKFFRVHKGDGISFLSSPIAWSPITSFGTLTNISTSLANSASWACTGTGANANSSEARSCSFTSGTTIGTGGSWAELGGTLRTPHSTQKHSSGSFSVWQLGHSICPVLLSIYFIYTLPHHVVLLTKHKLKRYSWLEANGSTYSFS